MVAVDQRVSVAHALQALVDGRIATAGGYDELRRLGTRHKVLGHLAWLGPDAVGDLVAMSGSDVEDLLALRDAVVRQAMVKVARAAAIVDALATVGIPAVAFKGPWASVLLHDDPAVRASGDVDLAVRPGDFDDAERVLAGMGFHRAGVWAGTGPEVVTNRFAKAVNFTDGSVLVDLHWRVSNVPYADFPSTATYLASAEPMEVAGGRVPVLSSELHHRHLVVHTVKHQARRLKWLLDVLAVRDRIGVDAVLAGARVDGMRRSTESMLSVVHWLEGGPEPSDRRARRVVEELRRPDGWERAPFVGWGHLFTYPDRWDDRARVARAFGVRMLPGSMPRASWRHPWGSGLVRRTVRVLRQRSAP